MTASRPRDRAPRLALRDRAARPERRGRAPRVFGAGLTALVCGLAASASSPARATEGSILVVGTSSVPTSLDHLAAAGSWSSVAEMLLLAVQPSLPDSAGFTRADPEKLSVRGGSARWTRWTVDGFELSDPLFAGAAAVRLPWRFLDGLALTHREDPRHAKDDAIAVSSRATSTSTIPSSETSAGVRYTFPDAGGIFPGARGLTRTFSTTHPTDRAPAPPDERRRFLDHLNLSLGHTSLDASGARLAYALELDQATRRFLGFTADPAEVAPLDEHVLGLSGALGYSPRGASGPYYLAAAEYSRRDRLFAELRHDANETARADRAVLFGGVRTGALRAAATLAWLELEARDRTFTRELRDPDGEAFAPWYPSGRALAARVELGLDLPNVYVASLQELVSFTPSVEAWSHPLTLDGAPFGRVDFTSSPTVQLTGDERVGTRGRTASGAIDVAWDLFVSTMFAANGAGVNTLVLPDAGGKLALTLARPGWAPFLALAKTPIAIDRELVRKLDPRWLDGRRATEDGTVYDHIGGANVDVAPGLRAASVYSAAAGLQSAPWRGGRFELQGVLRAYAHPYLLEYSGHPTLAGYFDADGRYYRFPGEHRYVLRNRPLSETPFYAGLELAVRHEVPGTLVLWAGFATYTAFGRTPLGNGATANDLGVIDESTASPNTALNGLASVDGDRAFALRALAAYHVARGLWLTATARHKDGRPFAFVDTATNDGQVAQTLASRRGSPLKWTRPLAGPREDFQLTIDAELQYTLTLPGLEVTASLLAANLFDVGNELGERQTPLDARKNRAALELQTPRSLVLGLDLAF